MASIEVMKERARIAGRFNLSARRDPEHRALVALAAQRAGESAVIIVTEINGTLYSQIIQAERVRNLGQDSRGVTTVASASGVTQPETAHEDLTIGTFLQYAQMIPTGSVVLESDLSPVQAVAHNALGTHLVTA